jgi:hypothetical protein
VSGPFLFLVGRASAIPSWGTHSILDLSGGFESKRSKADDLTGEKGRPPDRD